jgi:hypothetical protein
MVKFSPLPPKHYLDECFTYNPLTGSLKWKERPASHFKNHYSKRANSTFAGSEVGSKRYRSDGEPLGVCIGLFYDGAKRYFTAHRIVFVMMGVEIPKGFYVDHKDRNAFNNAWSNLRLATPSQNLRNMRKHKNRKHDLPKGVYRYVGKLPYRSQIFVDGKPKKVGFFKTAEEAHAAYCKAVTERFGEFARFA